MKITIEQIVKEFAPEKDDEVIPWRGDSEYIGFSVLRSYKKDCGFVPAVTRDGREDNKVLLKVGMRLSTTEMIEVPVFLLAVKYSKYRELRHGIDFNDQDAPTRESLSESERSKQPIDLEDREGFVMYTNPISFLNKELNKKVTLNEIIEDLYNQHLRTVSSKKGALLRAKLKLREKVCSRYIPIAISVTKKYALNFFGKEIKEDKEDFSVGLFRPYSFEKHIVTKYPNSLPFFSSDIRISLLNIFWVSCSLLLLWYFYFLKLSENTNFSETFAVGLVIILVGVFEFIIPYIILSLINTLIVFRSLYESKKFKFK